MSPNATKVPRLTWCTGSDGMRSLADPGATGSSLGASAREFRKRQSREHRSREDVNRKDGICEDGICEVRGANLWHGIPRDAIRVHAIRVHVNNRVHAIRVGANRGGSVGTGRVPQGPQICAKSATRRYGDRFGRRRWLRLVA